MAVNRYIHKFRQLELLKPLQKCRFCSTFLAKPEALNLEDADEEKHAEVDHQPSPTSLKRHNREINEFFKKHPEIQHLRKWFPKVLLDKKHYKNPDHLYLAHPKIAESIAKHMKQRIQGDIFIGESNAGFGLITKALLDEGFSTPIRIYEDRPEFQEYINKSFQNKNEIILHPTNFFSLLSYSAMDTLYAEGSIVSKLIEGAKMKSWINEPAITVVGTLTGGGFLKYLIKCLVLQKEPVNYGRIDLFLITYPEQWDVFTATCDGIDRQYKSLSILLQSFFDMELIDKYPRKYFLPWQEPIRKSKAKKDSQELFLVRLTMKKDFFMKADHFLPYYSFITLLYARGFGSVIRTCEKWIPNCGENIIVPKLPHKDYFDELTIFTKFKELNPTQLMAVYEELAAHEDFENSPFMDMVEQELVKTETIDTVLHEYKNQ